jgi:molybdopterin synthase catalytic subunit
MRIRVLLFGQLKDIVGQREEVLDLAPGTTLSQLLSRYGDLFPRFQSLVGSIACAVNQQYAPSSVVLNENDEVGFLPPVSGGSGGPAPSGEEHRTGHCAIIWSKIKTYEIAESLKSPEDGAAVIFEGIVRNNTRGRQTIHLDYEAYLPMAVNELEKLSQEALRLYQIRDVRIVHRLGRLEIGETSVAICIGSAHRGAAFDACRWIMESIKRTIPIWKKEQFEDGAVWVDGQPFPEDLGTKK